MKSTERKIDILGIREFVLDGLPLKNANIANKYVVTSKLGKGKFGEVYKGRDIVSNEPVAIKFEYISCVKSNLRTNTVTKSNELNILKHETQILNYLHNKRCRNISYIYWYGGVNTIRSEPVHNSDGSSRTSSDRCSHDFQTSIPALVMPYYEYSLFDLFTKIAPHPTTYSSMNTSSDIPLTFEEITRSVIRILEHIHETGVVHRDIKPHNFMVKNRELFLIDFGMATFFVDERYQHIKESDLPKEHLLGTLKYISINVHRGKEYTRRDDLISCGYLFMFLKNLLFWDRLYNPLSTGEGGSTYHYTSYPETHIHHPKNTGYKIAKELSNIEKCMDGVNSEHINTTRSKSDITDVCPNNILEYLRYVYNLQFSETPNYDLMIRKCIYKHIH